MNEADVVKIEQDAAPKKLRRDGWESLGEWSNRLFGVYQAHWLSTNTGMFAIHWPNEPGRTDHEVVALRIERRLAELGHDR